MVEKIRKAIYSGSFYPAEEKKLSSMIDGFLSQANPKKILGKLRALTVPHAGYIYSGLTAAFAYKALGIAKPKRIVLFGPSHHDYLNGAYGFDEKWETPLGIVPAAKSRLEVIKNDREHSLEVQLPFLQKVLADFEFVPVIYGEADAKEIAQIAEELSSKDSVIIASSDLSHYLPYEEAKQADNSTIGSILALDLEKFLKIGDACGKIGIAALIILARKNKWRPILLDYKNSGDTSGDKKGVVGYAAIAFVEEGR